MTKVDKQDFVSTVITRQALGRHGSIGSLYDIRRDKLERENVFNEQFISSSVIAEDCTSRDYFVDKHQSQKDTWNKLHIDESMQLSLITGLIQEVPEYLQQTKLDNRTVRVTFVFNMKIKQQYLPVNVDDLYKYFSDDALQNLNATHYISGITWGRCIFITFEDILVNSETAEQLENQLMASLKKTKINKDQIEFKNLEHIISNYYSLKITVLDGNSTREIIKTDKDASNIIEEIQQFNDKNEQQLEFELRPLERFADMNPSVSSRTIQEVSADVIEKVESIFAEIMQGKRMINNFLGKIELWKYWIPQEWKQIIFDKQNELKGIELKIQNQLGILLKQIRYGEVDEQEMIKVLDEFNRCHPSLVLVLKEFLKENSQIDFKIEILSEFDTGTSAIKRPNGNILLKTIISIDDFIENHFDHDIYLFHISNQWIKHDKINWYKQLRCFNKLQETEEKLSGNEPIFRVIDYDLHTHLDKQPNSCVIYHAHRGKILSEDVYRTISTSKFKQNI